MNKTVSFCLSNSDLKLPIDSCASFILINRFAYRFYLNIKIRKDFWWKYRMFVLNMQIQFGISHEKRRFDTDIIQNGIRIGYNLYRKRYVRILARK